MPDEAAECLSAAASIWLRRLQRSQPRFCPLGPVFQRLLQIVLFGLQALLEILSFFASRLWASASFPGIQLLLKLLLAQLQLYPSFLGLCKRFADESQVTDGDDRIGDHGGGQHIGGDLPRQYRERAQQSDRSRWIQ